MDDKEIKKANRKALPKFLLIMVICLIVGSDAIDEKLSIIIWITSAALILSYFLIAASYSEGFSTFENEKNILPFFIGIAAFLDRNFQK